MEITVEEPALIIVINKKFREGMSAQELYEATRQSWVLDKKRLVNVKYVLASYEGIVREVYEVDDWFDVFFEAINKTRYGFTGKVAPSFIRNKYLHRSTAKYKSRGNPIRYVNC